MSNSNRWIHTGIAFAILAASCAAALAGGEETFKGIIADSQCAMNVHSLSQSHKEMLEGKNVGTTDADCVWYCITQRGGRFVLQNKGRVYKLDKQDFTKDYAARQVKITGTYDKETGVIHVRSVELVGGPAQTAPTHN
ncbi:MAG TPA: hypothetical protein VEG64_08505 [Candidatus Sulfotelmatobacter sp.]|nr:hypothetical protein [Candidatus Sulfotelmatobacter sp.]